MCGSGVIIASCYDVLISFEMMIIRNLTLDLSANFKQKVTDYLTKRNVQNCLYFNFFNSLI